MSPRVLGLAFVLVACRTTSVRDDGAPPKVASVDPPKDAAPPPSEAGATTTDVNAFYPLVEGACDGSSAYAVGSTPVLVMWRDAWVMAKDTPKPLVRIGRYYNQVAGRFMDEEKVVDVGGPDLENAWLMVYLTTARGEDNSEVRLASKQWAPLPTPHGNFGRYGQSHVIPQPDGSLWVLGRHNMYADIPGEREGGDPDRYFAFTAKGEPLKMNLPGGDMAHALRLANGELVAAGTSKSGNAQLRRWSPTKNVGDFEIAAKEEPILRIGTNRAVLLLPKRKENPFMNYQNEQLQTSKVDAKDITSWLVTKNDELWVTSRDGTLTIETMDGVVTTEKLPEAARLALEVSSPWLMAEDGGAVYRRTEKSWTKLLLPTGPWTNEKHPPGRIEWVKAMAGETWVGSTRTDVGLSRKVPTSIRTIYSSSKPKAPFRCGPPYRPGFIGVYPPRVDASCKDLVVVVAGSTEKELENGYKGIGAKLKGDAALGETLAFMDWGTGDDRLLAVAAPSQAVVDEMQKKLPLGEPVCGAPEGTRKRSFDVKTGAFAQP